ncbi:MAG: hypothetical protein Tsb0016_13950 [Sphingomonadales bacterium]
MSLQFALSLAASVIAGAALAIMYFIALWRTLARWRGIKALLMSSALRLALLTALVAAVLWCGVPALFVVTALVAFMAVRMAAIGLVTRNVKP